MDIVHIITLVKTVVKVVANRTGLSETGLVHSIV